MANEAHLKILKEGVRAWNNWKRENPAIRPNLADSKLLSAKLSGADFSGANLSRAYLSEARLDGANLSGANLSRADLPGAKLSGANLSSATLDEAIFSSADLSDTNLSGAKLSGADLSHAKLSGADLSRAILYAAILSAAKLYGTNFSGTDLRQIELTESGMYRTIFGNVDLSEAKGLDTVIHAGPSTIGIDSIFRSKGRIPEIFLVRAGVPEGIINYMKSLVVNPIEYYSCFISYSSKDETFAKLLYSDLQTEHVRFFLRRKI